MFQVLLLTAVFLSANAIRLDKSITDCGKPEPNIKWVEVAPCDSEPCTLIRGTQVTITGQVLANHDVPSSDPSACKLIVKAQRMGLWIEIYNKDACKQEGKKVVCPFKKGDLKDFKEIIDISEDLPTGNNIKTRWNVMCNNNKDEVLCAEVILNVSD